jgi:hypothetical protein
LTGLLKEYTGQPTIVEIHSGFATGVKDNIQGGMDPIKALISTSESATGRPLTEKEITTLLINCAIGTVVEFGARTIMKIPGLTDTQLKGIKSKAQELYFAADWPRGGNGSDNTNENYDLAGDATSVADDAANRGDPGITTMFDQLAALLRKRGNDDDNY